MGDLVNLFSALKKLDLYLQRNGLEGVWRGLRKLIGDVSGITILCMIIPIPLIEEQWKEPPLSIDAVCNIVSWCIILLGCVFCVIFVMTVQECGYSNYLHILRRKCFGIICILGAIFLLLQCMNLVYYISEPQFQITKGGLISLVWVATEICARRNQKKSPYADTENLPHVKDNDK